MGLILAAFGLHSSFLNIIPCSPRAVVTLLGLAPLSEFKDGSGGFEMLKYKEMCIDACKLYQLGRLSRDNKDIAPAIMAPPAHGMALLIGKIIVAFPHQWCIANKEF